MRILADHEGLLISAGFLEDCQVNSTTAASLFVIGILVGLPLSIHFHTPLFMPTTGLAVTYCVSILWCSVSN